MVINAKGQIVIPQKLREKYGIAPGAEVEFEEIQGKLILIKKGVREQFHKKAKKYRFDFPAGIKSTKEFLQRARGA